MSGINLVLSDIRGVYIPRDFVNNFDLDKWHIDTKYIDFLSSPDNEFYWEYWDEVLSNAYFIDESGNKWYLWQDGYLWAICYELLTDEERINFGF
jgi:hypothetical protein